MEKDAGVKLSALRVDGGAPGHKTQRQLHAPHHDVTVRRPVVAETTALGAAYLAGLAVGYWQDLDDVAKNWALDREFTPRMDAERRRVLTRGWDRAVERSLKWIEP
jgi:glycerol kinase